MTEEIDYNTLTSYGDDEPSGAFYGKVNPYDGRNFYVTIRISDIRGSRFEECENPDTGEPEKGLFIPLRRSGVTVSPKKNVLATYKMEIAAVSSSHHSHLLRQVVDNDIERYWRELGYKHEFDGFARPVGNKKRNNYAREQETEKAQVVFLRNNTAARNRLCRNDRHGLHLRGGIRD